MSSTPLLNSPLGSGLLMAALLSLTAACSSGRESLAEGPVSFTQPEAPTEIEYDQANNELFGAYHSISDEVWQEKEVLNSELDQQLVAVDLKIEEVEDQAKNVPAAAKQAYEQVVDDMDTERERLVEQYQRINAATDENWEEVKSGVREVIQDVSLAVTNLATTLDQ
ncbi:sll1863 family stress response protein [Cesiribacter andamanensis]|uniref:Uncharacterized protein n=1 Tax=Cesiribacter andamanensis AMV16 TaxID=1279009 RepID=M7NGM9_9BACT|nr:hypothetical protein [Cesiribacter andamanensis]EMR00990.1 hypothetical protein ADICEAN_03887 [Cesiribacter andamanensis AMV16]